MEYKSKLIIPMISLLAFSAQAQDPSQCLTLVDDSERLACYDSALGFNAKGSLANQVSPVLITLPTGQPVTNIPEAIKNAGNQPASDSTLRKAQQAYDQIVADSVVMVITKIQTTTQRQTYYFTDGGRVFKKLSDRAASIKVDDRVNLEDGMLGSKFFVNQSGARVKVKEMD